MSGLHHIYFFTTSAIAFVVSKSTADLTNSSTLPVFRPAIAHGEIATDGKIIADNENDDLFENYDDDDEPYTGPWDQWWPAYLPTMEHKGKQIPKLELYQEIDILYEPDSWDIPWEFLVNKEFYSDGTKKSLTIMCLHFDDVEWWRPFESLALEQTLLSGMRGPCAELKHRESPDPCEIPIPRFIDGKYAGVGPSALERRGLGLPHPDINPDYLPMSITKTDDRSGEITMAEFIRYQEEEGLYKRTWEEAFHNECGWTPESGKPEPSPRTTMVFDQMKRDRAISPHKTNIHSDSSSLHKKSQSYGLVHPLRQPLSPSENSTSFMKWRKWTSSEKVELPPTPPPSPPMTSPIKSAGAWRPSRARSSSTESSTSSVRDTDSSKSSPGGIRPLKPQQLDQAPTKYRRIRSYANQERTDQIKSLRSWVMPRR